MPRNFKGTGFVRLDERSIKAITHAIHSRDASAKIYLYGSRADDSLKGGDIDLWVCSDTLKFPDKLDILLEIKARIGDQKIDLSIKSFNDSAGDPFFNSLKKYQL